MPSCLLFPSRECRHLHSAIKSSCFGNTRMGTNEETNKLTSKHKTKFRQSNKHETKIKQRNRKRTHKQTHKHTPDRCTRKTSTVFSLTCTKYGSPTSPSGTYGRILGSHLLVLVHLHQDPEMLLVCTWFTSSRSRNVSCFHLFTSSGPWYSFLLVHLTSSYFLLTCPVSETFRLLR